MSSNITKDQDCNLMRSSGSQRLEVRLSKLKYQTCEAHINKKHGRL